MTTLQRSRTKYLIRLFLPRLLTAVASGTLLFAISIAAVALLFQVQYLGKVYPGVHVGNVDLSGVRRAELAAVLNNSMTYPQEGAITFHDGSQSWTFTPTELGVQLDITATAQDVYNVGRQGWLWERWAEQLNAMRAGEHLAPKIIFDGVIAQARINEIARVVNRQALDAELHVNGLEVNVTPGQIGRTIDTAVTATLLNPILINMQSAELAVVIVEDLPQILDASAQAEIARNILSQPLTLQAADGVGGPWVLQPETLAGMLSIERVSTANGAKYQIGLEQAALQAFLAPLSPGLEREAADAKYLFNDDTLELDVIHSAVIGRDLLINESITQINQELAAGAHQINLVFDYINPTMTDETTGADLGITELVSVQTTYFYGSSAGRMQNIQAAAERFHGLMVPPGATFSMVENIGEISLDTGFAEALIIYGDRTIKGVGGGVCQVSTTLFRTVFFGGYPIVERYSHAYRVYYYELMASGHGNDDLAGLDATVYSPIVDFKFQNDTPYWLLMEVYVDIPTRSIMWKFYSTNDGRVVDWSTSGLQNIIKPPKPLFEETKDLAKGKIKQVDWAVEGADVTITRTVTRDDEVIIYDEFTTHYNTWQTVCEYGKGTNNYPPKEKKQDPYSCLSISS